MDRLIERLLWLRDILLENWKAKLGSLVVAIIFFYYVQYTRNITRIVHVKVDVPAIPETLVFNSRIPSFVKVEFFGPQEVMDFNPSNFRISLSNSSPGPGENRYRLDLVPKPPEGIEVRYDSGITIKLDRFSKRTLPVVGDFQLISSSDTKLGAISLQPETVQVAGPAGVLDLMDRVHLNTVRISPAAAEYSTRIAISTLPEFVKLADGQPYEIDVRAKLLGNDIGEGTPNVFAKEMQVVCENTITNLRLDEPPTVKVLYRAESAVGEGRIVANVYCPVFLDPINKSIQPSLRIAGIPVHVHDLLMQKDIEILDIFPSNVNLQFSMVRIRPPTQVQKGMEEHLIR